MSKFTLYFSSNSLFLLKHIRYLRQPIARIYLCIYSISMVIDAMTRKAKLFISGNSQAVRLPKDFRLEGDEVYIRRDPASGDIILSRKPPNWDSFLELVMASPLPPDFLADRDQVATLRDPFEDWQE
jgi:antitoxin VapB